MSKFLDENGLSYFWSKIKATLKTVAFTGSYNDLTNKPNIPQGATVDTALNSSSTNPVQNKAIHSALATKVTSAQAIQAISGAGYATSANASAIASSLISAGGYVTSTYVAGATVASAGNATNLNGSAASVYAKAADYLPLSGGTMTRSITRSGNLAKPSTSSGSINIMGADTTANGAGIWLYGNGVSSGRARIQVHGSAYYQLDAQTDGVLSWNGGVISATTFSGTATSATSVAGTAGTSTLSWNTDVTLYTVGGNAIKAKLPANPNTNTTYTFATGDSNGQIKITPSGGTAQNVSVKGLGTAAYTSTGAFAAATHTHSYLPLSGGTLTGTLNQSCAVPSYNCYDTDLTKGTNPNTTHWIGNLTFCDKTGNNGVNYRAGILECCVTSAGETQTYLRAYNWKASTGTEAHIAIAYPKDGTPYTYAPTPATADSSTKIATTAFVKAQGYKTTDNNTTYTFATGDSNGQIKVTPSGGTAQNVAVKGLGTAAYTASTAYATSGHTHNYLPLSGGTCTGTIIIQSDADRGYVAKESVFAMGNTVSGSAVFKSLGAHHDKNGVTMGGIHHQFSTAGLCFLQLRNMSNKASGYITQEVRLETNTAGSVQYFYATGTGCSLGKNTSNRWSQVVATSTSITTSDERYKTSVEVIPEDVLDAWGDVNWIQYQYIEAVEKKGEDVARLHSGIIAQRIVEIFANHNLDATRYGLLCYDEWEEEPETRNEKGEVIASGTPAGNMYSLRYEECLCMEAAYQRRRAERAEARITALEQRFNELEEVLGTLGDHSNAS